MTAFDSKGTTLRVDERIKAEPESCEPTQTLSIFEVPPKLSEVHETAFSPEIFSFGPLFHNKYKKYNDLKIRHLPSHFGGIFGDINGHKITEDIKSSAPESEMVEWINEAKQCYDFSFPSEPDYSLFQMVIDGCFIVELLSSMNEKTQRGACGGGSDSPIPEARWVLPSFQRDLIKLPNQIPFCFLEKLFTVIKPENKEPSLHKLFASFFCSKFSLNESIYRLDSSSKRKHAHPLDLFRSLFLPSDENEKVRAEPQDSPTLKYSAQYLHVAGIKIKAKENSSLLQITYDSNNRVLEIPPLSIDENMTVALLNFAAYEQCDLSKPPHFTNYLLFLDSLINNTKDVEILYKKKIISYSLGTEKKVVDLFNNFRNGMLHLFDETCLSVNIRDVNSCCDGFYQNKLRYWLRILRRERLSNPWRFLSLLGAVILLMLTFVQAIYAVISYHLPN